ncbi:hypothetical protein [Pectobacterium cacticida]|uniref:hypothetical protein n=1 Tax=Pectobacterium cacticida TaxID=69221 RepID=UPI003986034B
MPSITRDSSKQAARGGDHFHGMEWRGRKWRAVGSVLAGSRDFWGRVDVGGC